MWFFKKRTFIFILTICFTFLSCNKNSDKQNRIYLKDNLTWAPCTQNSLVEEIKGNKNAFTEFKKFDENTINEVKKTTMDFIWLKAEFKITNELKNKNLGFVVPFVYFADKVWLNNIFIGEHGQFPPNFFPNKYQSQYCFISKDIVNQEETNTLYIKLFVKGDAKIDTKMFISTQKDAYNYSERLNFYNSKIFMFFEGGMVCAFILFFLLYLLADRKSYYLYVALLNLATIPFISAFYSTELLGFTTMSYATYMKFVYFFSCYFITYFYELFLASFLHYKYPKKQHIVRISILFFEIVITALMYTYEQLMTLSTIVIPFCFIQIVIASTIIIVKKAKSRDLKRVILLMRLFTVILITIGLDLIFHGIFKIQTIPLFTLFGWQATIIGFIIILVVRLSTLFSQNKTLTGNLKKEVAKKTIELQQINQNLKSEQEKIQQDLQIAGKIQHKFLPKLYQKIPGWEISVFYSPLIEVSGDFFDLYIKQNKLKGFSIFDVSGHGLPASLVTMLSKHVISDIFYEDLQFFDSASGILMDVNELIIKRKGSIDNYMTGLLFKITDENTLQFANAGHPYPLLYKKETGEIIDLLPSKEVPQYGAIGIKDVEVSFVDTSFQMQSGDMLFCFTDGITEMRNAQNQDLGVDGLKEFIKNNIHLSIPELVFEFKRFQAEYSKDTQLQDDTTVMIVKKD